MTQINQPVKLNVPLERIIKLKDESGYVMTQIYFPVQAQSVNRENY